MAKEENQIIQKSESTGLFSSFFPFISQDSSTNKGPTQEEQEAIKNSQTCVEECHIEQLIHDTKFLRVDSLVELVKALIFLSQPSEQYNHSTDNNNTDLDASVFSLEILIKVVLQNRDRISCIWLIIRNHFYSIICNSNEYTFFLERAVVGLQRISVRLLRREELVNEVLSSLRMLLLIKSQIIRKISKQVAYGLHELIRSNAANINTSDDWLTLFSILQVVGAGAAPPPIITLSVNQVEKIIITSKTVLDKSQYTQTSTALSDPDLTNVHSYDSDLGFKQREHERGYTSDSELYSANSNNLLPINTGLISGVSSQQRNDWILVCQTMNSLCQLI